MKLNDSMFLQPLATTIYGERFLNDSKGCFTDHSEVDTRYDPQGSISHIDLPYCILPSERCVVLQSLPSQELLSWVCENGTYRFFWHPDTIRCEFIQQGTIRVQPTSSTRTLLTENAPHFYIKTDLDKKHFRFIRRLQRSSVEHSIAICNDLRQLTAILPNKIRYAFLPESLGIVVCGGKHEGSGVIFRETVPHPIINEQRLLLPYHALYANDLFCPEDKPLLVQIIEHHTDRDELNYFVNEIIGPLLEAWVMLVSQRGLLPELHGQNVLAEIDKQFRLRRVVHRDFQSMYYDGRVRTLRGLPLFLKHRVGSERGTTVASQYSIVFDNMISKYLLSRISKIFSLYFSISYDHVVSAIRDYHHSIAGWEVAEFPKTTYCFDSLSREQIGNEVRLVDTGKKPEFR